MNKTTLSRITSIVVAGACVVSIAACRKERERASREIQEETDRLGRTTTTGANVVSNGSAVDQIVAARCAREVSCNNVGPDKSMKSREGCVEKIRSDMREDLKASECPGGIDKKELDECLESIRTQDCNNPIDAISRLGACRTGDLCVKRGDMPNR